MGWPWPGTKATWRHFNDNDASPGDVPLVVLVTGLNFGAKFALGCGGATGFIDGGVATLGGLGGFITAVVARLSPAILSTKARAWERNLS